MGSTLGRRNWKPGITHRLANAIPAEAWWWEHHAVGMFFVRRNRETSQGQGKDAAIYSDILDDNLPKAYQACSITLKTLVKTVIAAKGGSAKHRAKAISNKLLFHFVIVGYCVEF